jgi:uncharacterized protein (TIGR02284 family)
MKYLGTAILALLLIAGHAFADQNTISQLNELLRGEISAVETYRQALEKVGDEPGSDKLRTALEDHKQAVTTLTAEVKRLGGVPSTDSGAWGAWAQTVTASAKILGDEAALKALKEGEEHGIKEYKEVLENEKIPQDIKNMIQAKFVPNQQKHIAAIDSLMSRM